MIPIPLPPIPWKFVAAAAAIAIVCFAVWLFQHQAKEIGALKVERDNAISVANANAAIAERQDKARRRLVGIAEKLALEKDAIRKNANGRRQKIIDAPASDDGPLAPVLGRVLDGLRAPTGSAGSGGATAATH